MKIFNFIVIMSISFMFTACGDDNSLVKSEDGTDGDIPEWYVNIPEDKAYYYGKGSSTSGLFEKARIEALANAKRELSESIKSTVKSKVRNAIKTNGSLEMDDEEIQTTFDSAVEITTDRTLDNVEIYKTKSLTYKSGTRWFIGVKLNKAEYEEKMLSELKKGVNKQITDPKTKANLNSLFDDDFFKEGK